MNEEEKQAIKILKSFEPIDLFEGAIYLQALEKLTNLIEKLQKENEELKADNYELNNRITDLLENIPVQIIEDFIKEYQKLGDEFYEKFLETNRTDKDLHDAGLACDAKVDVLKKVLKEGKEFDKAAEEIDKYCENGGENNDKSNKK